MKAKHNSSIQRKRSLTVCEASKHQPSGTFASWKATLKNSMTAFLVCAAMLLAGMSSTSAQKIQLEPLSIDSLPYFAITSGNDTLAILPIGQLEELSYATAYAVQLLQENELLVERSVINDARAEAFEELYRQKQKEIEARKHRESLLIREKKDCQALAMSQQNRLNIVEPRFRNSRIENWIWRAAVVAGAIVILR